MKGARVCEFCGGPLPPRKRRFCSKECKKGYILRIREAAKFELMQIFGLKKEFRFCSRFWRFDLADPDRKIAIEIEGGFRSGRHAYPGGFLKDMEKYNTAAVEGWMLLRVSWDHVIDGTAKEWVARAFHARGVLVE